MRAIPRLENINDQLWMIRLLLILLLASLISACAAQQSIKVETDAEAGLKGTIACEKYPESRLNKMRQEQGLDVFEISRCAETGYMVEENENELSAIADELFRMVPYNSKRIVEELNTQALMMFFQEHESVHELSLLDRPQRVRFRQGSWYTETGVKTSLLEKYMLTEYTKSLDEIYLKYNDKLKQLLDARSYFLYSLLAGRTDLTEEDFSLWDNPQMMPRYYKSEDGRRDISQLLDILIATKKYQQVERYKEILVRNYKGNPFKYFFLSTPLYTERMSETLKEIEQLRELGLDIFHYSYSNDKQDLYNDNLALAIIKNLKIYDRSNHRSDFTLLRELASGLNTCNNVCVSFYMELAIQYGDKELIGTLFDSLPHTEYTNEEISRLVWYSAKYNKFDVMKALFNAFKLEEYLDFQDRNNNLSALGYAKEHRNDKMVELLEAHGYKSSSVTDFFRQVKRGWSNTKETAEGVGYAIQLLLFGYH